MLGELDQADSTYAQAQRIYSGLELLPGSPLAIERGDLFRRLAYLRSDQRLYSEALELADLAQLVFASAEDDHLFGTALVASGTIHLLKADHLSVGLLSKALVFLEPGDWRAVLVTAHNLINALTLFEELEPAELETALELLIEARLCVRSRGRNPTARTLLGYRRLSPTDACLRYVQGRILVLLNCHDKARPLLERAREDFAELHMYRDLAAAGLELAECALWMSGKHRWHRIINLCREVLEVLSDDPDSVEAITAYRLLLEAAAARSDQALRDQITTSRSSIAVRS